MINTPNVLLTLAFMCATLLVRAEGTPELLAYNCNNFGSIQIWDNGDINRKFATWNAPEEFRLHIRVDYGDVIHLGFHTVNEYDDVWWRLKDPNGSVVMGPVHIQSGTKGWIDNCAEALNGPGALTAGGYDDTTYIAQLGGDYYIEFAENADPNEQNKRIIELFDITVSDGSNVLPGRLWSKAWDINCQGDNNAFEASMYAYSLDSVVTRFDFNGIRPWGFTISCNSYGTTDVGTLAQRRKSDYRSNVLANGGRPSAPEYPLFLNDPDPLHFPDGQFGMVDSFNLQTCNQSQNCIWVYPNKTGQVEVVMEFPDGSQINMIDEVSEQGACFEWNGLDGNDNAMQVGDTVQVSIKYATGITHLPLMDVENHDFGYTVELIRPSTKPNGEPIEQPLIFWNDSLLTDPEHSLDGIANLEGAGSGSHRWENRGTDNTNPEVINTWWYSSLEENSFMVICPVLLPLELGPFTGTYSNTTRNVTLRWSTYSESDLDQYLVERSSNGIHFETIGSVAAQNTANSYTFVDPDLPATNTKLLYRLKVADLNGLSEYSPVIQIQIDGAVRTTLSWNPGGKQFTLRSDQQASFGYTIHDLHGRQLQAGSSYTNQPQPVPAAAGVYLLRTHFNKGGQTQTYKLLVQ